MLKRTLLLAYFLLVAFVLLFASPGWETAWEKALNVDWSDDSNYNFRHLIAADESAFSGTKIRITCEAGTTGNFVLTGTSIGVMTTDEDYDAAATRITWVDEGGGNGITIPQGTTVVSDEITFTFTKTSRHGIHLYAEDWLHARRNLAGDGYYWKTVVSDDTMVQNLDGYALNATVTAVLTKLEVLEGNGEEENAIFFGINFLALLMLLFTVRRKS